MYLYTKKKTRYPYGKNKSSSEPEELFSSKRNPSGFPAKSLICFNWLVTVTHYCYISTIVYKDNPDFWVKYVQMYFTYKRFHSTI